MIKSNPESAVGAQTGSGKTLCLPYLLAMDGLYVRVALPYTVATRAAYRFQTRHSGPKIQVGFAAAREVRYRMSDHIVYATTGHFVAKILHINKKHRPPTVDMFDFLGDVFIVDEVHSGTTQITQLIGLLSNLQTRFGASFKTHIVFTSATMNHLDVSRHFTGFPTYEVELKRLPITHVYSERERDPRNTKDDPTEDIIRIIRKELRSMSAGGSSKASAGGSSKAAAPDIWHIIVFRPGVQEVEDLVQNIERQFDETELVVIPAYSELSQDELEAIHDDFGVPKIIIGTNIIESSITIENVGAIVNDGLVKRVYTNDTGGQKLVTTVVSRSEEIQRAGRTARTRPGTAYHLYTTRYREECMEQHHPPEIDRVPIHCVTLSCIDAGLPPREILGISASRQQQAIDMLVHMGMIDRCGDSEGLGTVTDAGDFVSHVNIGIYNACLIYDAIEQYRGHGGPPASGQASHKGDELVLRSVVALAVMLESYGPPPYYVPRRTRGQTRAEYQLQREVHIEKYFQRFMGSNEIETLVKMYWIMLDEVYDIEDHEPSIRYPYKEWAVRNSMNNKKLSEFRNTYRSVMGAVANHLNKPQFLDDVAAPEPTEISGLMSVTLEMFKHAYSRNTFTLSTRSSNRRTYVRDGTHNGPPQTFNLTAQHYCLPATSAPPDKVIAAQVMEIQSDPSGPVRRIIGLTVPIHVSEELDTWGGRVDHVDPLY
jgi:hypothetical protein